MSQHAGPPPAPGQDAAPAAPQPTFAERARTLVHAGRTGMLATLSRRHRGHPFASVMPYAPDDQGRPVLLVSSLAVHTQNLRADPRASLLITEASEGRDPLATGRVTLMGAVVPVPAPELLEARAGYLARHPAAEAWVDFEDFAFQRLAVEEVYVVGGFAAMDWVPATEYAGAAPDPLTEAARGIIDHMNRDHPDALLTLARALGGAPADEATMVGVDRLGFKLRVRTGPSVRSLRIPFPREVTSPAETRTALVAMLRDARGGR